MKLFDFLFNSSLKNVHSLLIKSDEDLSFVLNLFAKRAQVDRVLKCPRTLRNLKRGAFFEKNVQFLKIAQDTEEEWKSYFLLIQNLIRKNKRDVFIVQVPRDFSIPIRGVFSKVITCNSLVSEYASYVFKALYNIKLPRSFINILKINDIWSCYNSFRYMLSLQVPKSYFAKIIETNNKEDFKAFFNIVDTDRVFQDLDNFLHKKKDIEYMLYYYTSDYLFKMLPYYFNTLLKSYDLTDRDTRALLALSRKSLLRINKRQTSEDFLIDILRSFKFLNIGGWK